MLSLILFATAATAASTPADPGERVRCVRENVSGSLVQTRKICHTEREWERLRSAARAEGETMNNQRGWNPNPGG